MNEGELKITHAPCTLDGKRRGAFPNDQKLSKGDEMLSKLRIVWLCCLGALAWSCDSSAHGANEGNDADGATKLPVLVLPNAQCDPDPAPELGICEWLLAPDAIVIGSIVDVRIPNAPMVAFEAALDGPSVDLVYVDECEAGTTFPNLTIEIDVDEVLVGEAPLKLTAYVGWYQRELWSPKPGLDERGSVVWAGGAKGFSEGDVVGLSLYLLPEQQIYTIAREPLFTLVHTEALSSPSISFQERRGQQCPPFVHDQLDGLSLMEARTALTDCTNHTLESRVSAYRKRFALPENTQAQANLFAAYCSRTDAARDDRECGDDDDCEPNMACIGWRCMPQ